MDLCVRTVTRRWISARLLLAAALIHIGDAVVQSAEEPPSRPPWQRPSMLQPVFLNTTSREVVTAVGRPAYLHCMIQHPGDKTVSWVRKSDLHILTVGTFTYTTDKRFQALHADGTQEWTLKVLAPTLEDSGVYECQVSTEPKISQPFNLSVVVARAVILGGTELHVRAGSDVNLTCQGSPATSSLYWYHNGAALGHAGHGRRTVLSQPSRSRLLVTQVSPEDAGNYTCAPAGTESASVIVHVIDGEHRAAMLNVAGPVRLHQTSLLTLLTLLVPALTTWLVLR